MFKIGFFPQGNGGGGISPDPIGNYFIIQNSNSFTPWRYMAYQITGIAVPISLRIEHNLQTVLGSTNADVYYAIDPAWPYGNVITDIIFPTSNYYATFQPTNTDVTITVNNGDWLILAVEGGFISGSFFNATGTVKNVSSSNTTISNLIITYNQ